MAHRCYSEIRLHITWHTKYNEPYLTEKVEAEAHEAVRPKALETKGVIVHAINGTANHVHLAVTVPTTVRISEFVGQVKGASSHAPGKRFLGRLFGWLAGYGVVSFGTKALPWVIASIENQKEHHATGKTQERLERTDEEGEPLAAGSQEPVK